MKTWYEVCENLIDGSYYEHGQFDTLEESNDFALALEKQHEMKITIFLTNGEDILDIIER